MKNSFLVNIEGQEKEVIAEVIDKKIWFRLDEQTYSYDLLDLSDFADHGSRKSKISGRSPQRIIAPMPGKVIKIFASENQTVKKGDTLLVMEAMKMEYTLKTDIEAIVEKVFSKVGDQVTLGFLLIQLKEIELNENKQGSQT